MSKIYYDNLLDLAVVEEKINELVDSTQEKHKLWNIVDEMIHHRVMDLVLDKLHKDHHQEFLSRFFAAPYDENILVYLGEKIEEDINKLIRDRITQLVEEVMDDLRKKD